MSTCIVVKNAEQAHALRDVLGIDERGGGEPDVHVVYWGYQVCARRFDTILLLCSFVDALDGSNARHMALQDWYQCDLLTSLKPNGEMLP